MIVDIEKIKADIEKLELMDVDAEVETHLDEIREQIVAERDKEIAKLQAVLDTVGEYEVVEEEEAEDEANTECEECENAEECGSVEDVIDNSTIEA